jgi:hypothetical protein
MLSLITSDSIPIPIAIPAPMPSLLRISLLCGPGLVVY